MNGQGGQPKLIMILFTEGLIYLFHMYYITDIWLKSYSFFVLLCSMQVNTNLMPRWHVMQPS
jgi:hypothetical protein